ncbi:hypothetical protein SH2C18_38490 [Clostridium sediminicola]|uniref:ester cyclase n=1 Tax=Clostridium sediminicola TaxID=3114879 RepID=UPI0031F1D6DD
MSSLNLQNKRMVKEYYDRLYGADESNIGEILSDYFTEDTSFDCSHPVNHIQGLKAMIEQFWKPFLRAFPDALKHPYILTGATDVNCEGQETEFKNSDWVCANGYYEATFTEEFLDIPPTGGVVYIRFCECSQIKDGKIVQTYMLLDLLDLLAQAGYVFFNALGNECMIPGPRTFDGVILEESDAEKGSASINLITNMHEDLNTFADSGYEGFNLETKFKKDFSWYGPYGIGVCKGIEGFQKFHQVHG